MMKWEIVDDNGTIYSGTQEKMQLIWDIITRDIPDLESEYRHTYSQNELVEKKRECMNVEWSGKLKLIEIHNTYKE